MEMHKRNLLTLGLISTFGLAASPVTAEPDWLDEYPSVGFGVQSVESQGAALSRYVDFAPYHKDKLGADLDVFLASDYAGVIQALIGGQIEFMHMGASGYAAAYLQGDGNVEPLVTAMDADGSTGYYSVMFVRADSDYESLEDVEGATFAWADPNSTSGYLMPNHQLREEGIDPDEYFEETLFSGGHEQSLIGVMNGTYDVAVNWTNNPEEHTRGGLHMMIDRGVIDADDIRIIWQSDLIPNPVFAARGDLPEQLKEDWKEMLLNLEDEDPEIFREVARGESAGFVEVTHEDYAPIVSMREALMED